MVRTLAMRYLLLLFLFVVSNLFGQNSQLDRAHDLVNKKQYKQAKVILVDLAKTDASPEVKGLLAETYGNLREWDPAITLYKELVEQSPNDAELQFNYGGVLARKAESGSRVKALMLVGKIKKSFVKSANLDPKHVEVRWGLIEFHTAVPAIFGGSTSKAYTYARELQKISPIEGHFALAYLYGLDDKPEKAEEHLRKTIPYFKKNKSIERNQLNYLIGKVCSDFSIDLEYGISRIMEYIDNYGVKDGVVISQAYYQMAKLYRLKGDKETASIWIKKALRSDSDFELALEERKIIDML